MSLDALRMFQKRAARTTAVASVLLLVTALLVIMAIYPASDRSYAGGGPKNIRGYVYDSLGNPLAGAQVTVLDVTSTKSLSYDPTEPDGFYTVTFAPSDWNEGDTIQVTASFSGNPDVNTTTADDKALQFVNVTIYAVTIPEFDDFIHSPITFVSIGMIALFVIVRRRASR